MFSTTMSLRRITQLPLANPSFTSSLPPDELTPNPDALKKLPDDLLRHLRSVNGLFTYVKPQPPEGQRKLLSISKSVCKLLNLDYEYTIGPGRQEFTDIMSGAKILEGATYWAQCYGGHQFGIWAGQLGDGRAITIFETETPNGSWEVQLKGAGRTPYSRFADGRAVLRSSIREYLGSEAVHALGIPTTRALSLISLPDMKIYREEIEPGAIVSRLAPTWIRFGTFEILDFRRNRKAFMKLAQYTAEKIFKLRSNDKQNIYAFMLDIIGRETAHTIAGWQVYGYMNGVMNTDNMHISGLTLDYGPFAFMDMFDFDHICNHSDTEGRYSYRRQPKVAQWNLAKLGLCQYMCELVGAPVSEISKPEFLNGDYSADKKQEFVVKGLEVVSEMLSGFTKLYNEKYAELFRKRLGLRKPNKDDIQILIEPLLHIMHDFRLDFHKTLRHLAQFPSSAIENVPTDKNDIPEDLLEFFKPLMPEATHNEKMNEVGDRWISWFKRYHERLKDENTSQDERIKIANQANPVFVLRQWVLQEIINRTSEGEDSIVDKVLEMCENPFKDWTKSEDEDHRRFCDIGPIKYRGFQCSCSS